MRQLTAHGFSEHRPDPQRPQAARIGALAAAISLNLGALLVLAMPMQATRIITAAPERPPTQVVPIQPEVPPPPPMPAAPARPAPPQPRQVQSTPQPTMPLAPPDHRMAIPRPEAPVLPPVGPVSGTAGATAHGSGGAFAALDYVHAPPPAYPAAALRRGQEGMVWLRVLVGANGRPLQVEVDASSGHSLLDNAARQQVLQHWRFQPANRGGEPVQAWARVPVNFSIPAR